MENEQNEVIEFTHKAGNSNTNIQTKVIILMHVFRSIGPLLRVFGIQ
jgi:hypothetical protein